MKITQLTLLVTLFWLGTYSPIFGQQKSIISIENRFLIAKFDNTIRIVAQQENRVSLKQLKATFQQYDSEKEEIEIIEENGYFIIHPDTFGTVEIKITIGDTVETKILRVKPLEAIGRFGRFGANTDEKISIGEFKAQMGIFAIVECCGFDAKCQISGFQTIRISSRNQIERAVNKGASFEEATKRIITKAESGDIFVFRQIKYKCPGSGETQKLDDMIFEIE